MFQTHIAGSVPPSVDAERNEERDDTRDRHADETGMACRSDPSSQSEQSQYDEENTVPDHGSGNSTKAFERSAIRTMVRAFQHLRYCSLRFPSKR